MINFHDADLAFLISQLKKGNVVLFAGAGFAVGARNSEHKEPPLGSQLAELLCAECGWPHSGDELSIVYDQAEKHLGTVALRHFLERHYKDCIPGEWHLLIPKICWSRIFTTNIDDVIERSYTRTPGQQALDSITCPNPFVMPDLFMERVSGVHLHGSVLDSSKRPTFTLEDFARVAVTPNPWYQALMDDMQAKSVLFVGTRLTEPPFHYYLALRSERAPGGKDSRAKGFLVSPNITPVRRRQLLDQNIVPIAATAEEFFMALSQSFTGGFPQRTEVLRALYPHQIDALEREDLKTPRELLRQFDFIVPSNLPQPASGRSLFYLGAEPTWSDIHNNVDAHRDIHDRFRATILEAGNGLRCHILAGYAGSGKSAVLMRSAYDATIAGKSVYYFKGEQLLDPSPFLALAESLGDNEVYIFIDNATRHFRVVGGLVQETLKDKSVVFVLADRSHNCIPKLPLLEVARPTVTEMPELTRTDTERILDKLHAYGFLGILREKPRQVQISAFLVRAHKQLLVALREATSGKGFDAILASEYDELANDQARLAYVMASLVAMHGVPGVRRRYLLAALDGTDVERARILNDMLRDVVVPRGRDADLLTPRHRVIGRFVAIEVAPLEVRIEAMRRLLIQLSSGISPDSIRRRSPEFLAYRGMINYDGMSETFGHAYEVIRQMYEDVRPYYDSDFLFWLQYGRAELEQGNFDLAKNYLDQSLAIRADSHQTLHYMGVLLLKRAYSLWPYGEAINDAHQGERLLRGQIELRGDSDPYPYAALLVHKLRFLERATVPDKQAKMQELYDLAKTAREKHRYDEATREACARVERAYLMQAVR